MNKRGSNLIELLLALACFSLVCILINSLMHILINSEPSNNLIRTKYQLQMLYARSVDHLFFIDAWYFYMGESDLTLEVIDDSLVITPGWQVIYKGFDYAYFEEEGKCKYFIFEESNKVHEIKLGC